MKKLFFILLFILYRSGLEAQVTPVSTSTPTGSATQASTTGPYNLTPSSSCHAAISAGAIWFDNSPTSNYNMNFDYYFDIQFDAQFDKSEEDADGIVAVFGSNVGPGSVNYKGGCIGYYNATWLGVPVAPAFDNSVGVEFDIFNNGAGAPLFDMVQDHTAVCINANPAPLSGGGPVAINGATGVHDGLWHHYEILWCPTSQLLKVYYTGTLLLSTHINPYAIFTHPTSVPWGFMGATQLYCSNSNINNVVINTTPSTDNQSCDCSPFFWLIDNMASIEPASGTRLFSDGHVFMEGGITIYGPAAGGTFKNPNPNTLLLAREITVESSIGYSFQAVPQNNYFELLPKSGCDMPCSISGPSCVPDITGGSITLIGTPSGGNWSTDNPYFSVSPSGVVALTSSTPIPSTATITYANPKDGCSVSWHISLCDGSGPGEKSSNFMSKPSISADEINLYPNPTQNNITISYPCKSAGQLAITIRDVAGRTKYTEQVTCTEGTNVQHVVDMSTFTPGIYFVDLTLNEQHVVKKVVKM